MIYLRLLICVVGSILAITFYPAILKPPQLISQAIAAIDGSGTIAEDLVESEKAFDMSVLNSITLTSTRSSDAGEEDLSAQWSYRRAQIHIPVRPSLRSPFRPPWPGTAHVTPTAEEAL